MGLKSTRKPVKKGVAKTGEGAARPAGKKAPGPVKKRPQSVKPAASDEVASMTTGIRNRMEISSVAPAPETPPKLLSDSKVTAAALNQLEKAIRLLYQKNFAKAKQELEALIAGYPSEAEIIVRARSYIQICEREEAGQKKPAVSSEQLYSLGVMEHNRGNYERSISYFRQSLQQHPAVDYIHYSLAASLALGGLAAEAIRTLRKAIELNEDNRIYAKNDLDFAPLHNRQEFVDLIGLEQSPTEESSQT